jgi:hypothetical protein
MNSNESNNKENTILSNLKQEDSKIDIEKNK